MNIYRNTHSFLENSLKIGSAIFLVVGASLIIPKIADAALNLDSGIPKYSNSAAQNSSIQDEWSSLDSSGYQPPNFGHPSSAYGSGTR